MALDMVLRMDRLSERVLARIRDEMREQGISQPDLAAMLKCSQSRISKILTAAAKLKVDTLSDLCLVLSLPVTEVVRDRGMEFVAEMTPTELRVFQQYRKLTPDMQETFAKLLSVRFVEPRRALDRKKKKKS